MPGPRAPWWLFILAASFIAFFLFAAYCRLWEPEPEGFVADYRNGAMVLRQVSLDTPAARAGLGAGDHIDSVNGQALHGALDWLAVRGNMRLGQPLRFEIERNGNTHVSRHPAPLICYEEFAPRLSVRIAVSWSIAI